MEKREMRMPGVNQKPYPSREARIAMAETKIMRLEALNQRREALIANTEQILAQRKDDLERSTKALQSAIALRDKLVNLDKEVAPKLSDKAEKALFRELKQRLAASGKTVGDILANM